MRIGVFSDAHDHVDHVRLAVAEFNRRECELVLFAGDFVSPMVIPPLRKLKCPVIACFGDNDGNQRGVEGGMRIVGVVGHPPFGLQTADGTRILLAHQAETLRGLAEQADAIIVAHTHKPSVSRNERGALVLNAGETSGWTYRRPTIAILETSPLSAEIVPLAEMPLPPSLGDEA